MGCRCLVVTPFRAERTGFFGPLRSERIPSRPRLDRVRSRAIVDGMRSTALRTTALVAAALAAFTTLRAQDPSPSLVPPLDVAIDATTRLLVIAPHPDDETLGAAGLIHRVIARGG